MTLMVEFLDFGKYNLYIWSSYICSITVIFVYLIIISIKYKKAFQLLEKLKSKKFI